MRSQTRFVFMVFFFTGVLIFTVLLRSAHDKVCYQLCVVRAEENRLKQQLWQKQIHLESLINPAAVITEQQESDVGNDG